LEARADPSFFQTWRWVGCLGAERYAGGRVLRAVADGRTVALALLGTRRGFHLNETGDPALDCVFMEHNGVLLDRDAPPGLLARCLAAAAGRCLTLSGVDGWHLAAAAGLRGRAVLHDATRPSPLVDLASLRQGGTGFLDSLSGNARQQLRRATRAAALSGPLALARAADAGEAHDWLDRLAALHQATWQARGRPGAFAAPHFGRFHHALIDRAHKRREVDLLRATAGTRVLGYLYNFRHRGRVSTYQSGFDYAGAAPHEKPGLICHHLAIEAALADGADSYDFLAGDARYKTSLANAGATLHWCRVVRVGSIAWMLGRLRGLGKGRGWQTADQQGGAPAG
jgi:CelD/BcsL family acetyltransferase involved in cellulose biosynthesis